MKSLIPFILLFLIGCNSYVNKELYKLKVGEEVEIYYSTNSCCYYCLSNEMELKHLKLNDRKTIKGGDEPCDGCDYVAAFVFRAESLGIDTVELKLLSSKVGCDNNDVKPEKYIIEVK